MSLPKILVAVCCFSLFLCTSLSAQKKAKQPTAPQTYQLLLANAGASSYRIVLPAFPTVSEQKAGQVLQKYLLEISGTALPVISASASVSDYEILIGQNERLGEIGAGINFNTLDEDGFLIRTIGNRLVIAGGSDKGALYGVYSFLETYLGCRMYSPTVKIIPKKSSINLGAISDLQIPVFKFRDTHYKVAWDTEYSDWHKQDHDAKGGKPDWGRFVHTYAELVPPDIYFASHPEYYSLVKGKRLPTQLCLSNTEVFEIAVQSLRKLIAQNPAARYWSVSQNDNHDYCTCEKCKGIDDREGSPSGSIVSFANKVAEQFPDKIISTLAYEYGRHAPKNLKPLDNVNIMLCSIEAFRHKPLTEDSNSASFVKDVEDWGKIAKDIIVWDYVIQFPNLISPFPNLHVLQPNIQFFAKHGVNAMFEQGNREVGGEFAALRTYLICKLLWNPDQNVDSLMNDFLNGYYGAAGKHIRQYIDELHQASAKSGKPLRIFGNPNEEASSFLTPDLMARYGSIFDQAQAAVKDSAAVLERVRIARLPLEYAYLEQSKKIYTGDRGVFQKVNGQWEVRDEIRTRTDDFTDLCVREGVTRVKEWCTSPDEYRASMFRLFSLGMKEHYAYKKKVSFISPDGSAIKPESAAMLTDGVRASHEYDHSWFNVQGGKDLELVVDLEETRDVRRLQAGFLQFGFWLRLFPSRVEFSLSTDGKQYEPAGSIANTLPIDQYGNQQRDFTLTFPARKARYVKMKAFSIGNTPSWHPGAGRPAVMLVDEIVVE